MNSEHLTSKYKANRADLSDNFRLRIHRSLSWLERAEEATDEDIKFITLWIAFNAVYARKVDLASSERNEFRRFLNAICKMDKEQKIYLLVWQTYSGSIRLLLDNKYIFQPFWDAHNGLIERSQWENDFEKRKEKVHKALANKDTSKILFELFNRLYTLRNQIIHGGATHNSQVNRQQIKDANDILQTLLPLMLEIMMSNHTQMDWGIPFYPVVD